MFKRRLPLQPTEPSTEISKVKAYVKAEAKPVDPILAVEAAEWIKGTKLD